MAALGFLDRPAARRATRFSLAIGGAAFLLWALAVRARSGPKSEGPGAGMDEVRLIAAAICAVAALVAPRIASRVEAVGFWVAAAALVLSVLADHALFFAMARLSVPGAPERTEQRMLALVALSAVVVLGGPLAFGAWRLRIPVTDLLRPPKPAVRPLALAAIGGVLAYPVLSVATFAVNALVDAWARTHTHPWPGLRNALHADIVEGVVSRPFHWIVLALAIELPLLELLLHGVLRQALSRWGIVGFVVGTAILAPVVLLSGRMSFFLFGGCLATGFLAARSASVVPGFAFWASLAYGWIAWGWILPPG